MVGRDVFQIPHRHKYANVGRNKVAMIISFDLDDTLIPGKIHFATERQNLIQRLVQIEKIRVGTNDLFKSLRTQGHKVYIYTTSLRSLTKIKWTLLSYGIRVDKIINQKVHDQIFKENYNMSSKYPPAFNIDIHIDDSKGVGIEGTRNNFRTIIIAEQTVDWVDFILKSLSTAQLP